MSDPRADLLVESHPRAIIDRMLSYLCFSHGASGAMLLHVDGDQPTMEAVHSIRPSRACDLDQLWWVALPMLRAGTVTVGDDYVLAPLLGTGGLTGALFLDAPAKFYRPGLDRHCATLETAMQAARRMGPETWAVLGLSRSLMKRLGIARTR